jgi:hypothetical protein
LRECFERTFWKDILEKRFGKMFWKDVLRRSDNNLPDLLYNSNEPSNAIKPRGLGGTPIKKNHLKKNATLLPPGNFLFAAFILLSSTVGTNRANRK